MFYCPLVEQRANKNPHAPFNYTIDSLKEDLSYFKIRE